MGISDVNPNPELSVAALQTNGVIHLLGGGTIDAETAQMAQVSALGIAQSLWQCSLCIAFPGRAEQPQRLPCLQQAQRHQDLLKHLG